MTLSTEDRLEIHELVARYIHTIEHGDLNDLNKIWDEQCCFQFEAMGMKVEGLASLRDFFETNRNKYPQFYHSVSNIFVDIDDTDDVVLHATVQVVDGAKNNSLILIARYRTIVVKTTNGWRIRNKQVFTDVEPIL